MAPLSGLQLLSKPSESLEVAGIIILRAAATFIPFSSKNLVSRSHFGLWHFK